jgi:hypothetical protein
MLVMIPTECRNPVSFVDAQAPKGYRQFFCPSGEVLIGVAMDAPVRESGDDLLSSE